MLKNYPVQKSVILNWKPKSWKLGGFYTSKKFEEVITWNTSKRKWKTKFWNCHPQRWQKCTKSTAESFTFRNWLTKMMWKKSRKKNSKWLREHLILGVLSNYVIKISKLLQNQFIDTYKKGNIKSYYKKNNYEKIYM